MEKQLSATLRQYEVFVAIAETLHFGQAAANLGVAQPALTQQLKHLETVFGGELLFDRNRRRVMLTDFGKSLLPEARALLQQARRVEALAERTFELTEGGRTPRFGQDQSAYMLRVDRIVEAYTPPLEDLRDDLVKVLERQRQAEALGNAAQDIQARIETGELTLEQAAAEYGTTVNSTTQAVTRRASSGASIPQSFVPGVFSLRQEGDVQALPTERQDEVAILRLDSIDRPSAGELQALAPTAAPQVRQQLANDLLEAYVAAIESDVNLEVNPQAFQAYKARVNPDT